MRSADRCRNGVGGRRSPMARVHAGMARRDRREPGPDAPVGRESKRVFRGWPSAQPGKELCQSGRPSRSRYSSMVAWPAASHENSRSTMARPRAPSAARSTPGPSAPLIAAASADGSPAGTSQPFRPVPTLSGRPPALLRDDRAAMRHRLERDERAALVQRRMHEQVAASYHACSVAIVHAPGEQRALRRARRRAIARVSIAAIRAVADQHPSPAPAGNDRRRGRAARPAPAASTWKPLFASSRPTLSSTASSSAMPAAAGRDAPSVVACRQRRRATRRSSALGIVTHLVARHRSRWRRDRRLERPVGGDDRDRRRGRRRGPPAAAASRRRASAAPATDRSRRTPRVPADSSPAAPAQLARAAGA